MYCWVHCFFAGLVLLVASLAACDAVVPNAPPPEEPPETVASAENASSKDPDAGLDWAFPRHIEESRIVFSHLTPLQDSLIISKMSADGTGLVPLSFSKENPGEPDDRFFETMRWSPDGRHIVFVGITGPDEGHLVLIDSSGTRRRVLTPVGEFVLFPRWSPKGDRILYLRGSFGAIFNRSIVDTLGNSIDLHLDPDSRVFEGDSVFYDLSGAQWLPDGDHLAVVGTIGKRQDDPTIMPEEVEIFRLEVSTGRVVERLTHNQIDERGFLLSPDGQRLVVVRRFVARDQRLYVMELDGAVLIPVTPGPSDGSPRWADDGRHLLYIKSQDLRSSGTLRLVDTMDPERNVEVFPGRVFDLDIFGQPIIDTRIERR